MICWRMKTTLQSANSMRIEKGKIIRRPALLASMRITSVTFKYDYRRRLKKRRSIGVKLSRLRLLPLPLSSSRSRKSRNRTKFRRWNPVLDRARSFRKKRSVKIKKSKPSTSRNHTRTRRCSVTRGSTNCLSRVAALAVRETSSSQKWSKEWSMTSRRLKPWSSGG